MLKQSEVIFEIGYNKLVLIKINEKQYILGQLESNRHIPDYDKKVSLLTANKLISILTYIGKYEGKIIHSSFNDIWSWEEGTLKNLKFWMKEKEPNFDKIFKRSKR